MTKHNQTEENKDAVFSVNTVIRLKNLDEVNLSPFRRFLYFILFDEWD